MRLKNITLAGAAIPVLLSATAAYAAPTLIGSSVDVKLYSGSTVVEDQTINLSTPANVPDGQTGLYFQIGGQNIQLTNQNNVPFTFNVGSASDFYGYVFTFTGAPAISGVTLYDNGVVNLEGTPSFTGSSVSFNINGDTFPLGSNIGVNLAFAAAAVPEAATWAMMIVGFGLAGVMLRRREGVRARVSFA